MTNGTVGFGLRPVRRQDSSAPNYALNQARIAYDQASTIAKWDPVILNNDGTIDIWASGAIYGVFYGCTYVNPSTGQTDWFNTWAVPTLASGTIVTAWIVTDYTLIYQVRAAVGTNITQADVGQNAIVTLMGTPSPVGGRGYSTATLSTLGTTDSYPLTIVGLSQLVGNDNAAVNNIVEVIFNNSFFKAGVTGV